MQYEVRVVEDTDLPKDVGWAFARVAEGVYLFVKRSRMSDPDTACRAMTAAWMVWVAMGGEPVPVLIAS